MAAENGPVLLDRVLEVVGQMDSVAGEARHGGVTFLFVLRPLSLLFPALSLLVKCSSHK